MSAVPLKAAYILHQRPYRSTSLLLEALTAEAGRVGLVARGARRQGAKRGGLLQPFRPLLLAWHGRGELKTLSGAEVAGAPPPRPRGRALFAGYYCNELILRLYAREAPDATVFAAYQRTVAALDGEEVPLAALRLFELDLLDALGYAPALVREADTGVPVEAACTYDFLPESGPRRASSDEPVPGAVRVRGSELLALADRELHEAQALAAAQRILRASMDPLLGPRPLKSREIYRSLFVDGPSSP